MDATGTDLSAKFSSGMAQANFDNDGFIDVAVMTAPFSVGELSVSSEDFVLLHNQGNKNHWLTVRLIGTHSNRNGIGALVQLKTGKNRQLREIRAGISLASSESPWPTFGLGKHRRAKITVTWPSGLIEQFPSKPANRSTTLIEGTGKIKRLENLNKGKPK